jgi:glutathione S-transferase
MGIHNKFKLISHKLCPYVQRSVITLKEKGIDFERVDIDLANKPEWFRKLSPLGKVPILVINDEDVLFESNVITEYLNEVTQGNLHLPNPITKAKHRAWIEFGSSILNNIAGLYNAPDSNSFQTSIDTIRSKFESIEQYLALEKSDSAGGYFAGEQFLLIDAVYGPIFRYFNVFAKYAPLNLFENLENVNQWRQALNQRLSVKQAVNDEYPELLRAFVLKRHGYLASFMNDGCR